MTAKTRTRKPTAAERLAARALGRPEPEEIVEDMTSSAVLHAERLVSASKSAKPAGMSTAAWYARRALGGAAPAEDDGVEEVEEEPRSLPQWARRMAYRPGGGDAA